MLTSAFNLARLPELKAPQPENLSNIPGLRSGFTLIELVVVISVISVVSALLVMNLGTFTFWKQETFLRKLTGTIEFLHYQAVVDQAFYQLEIDFDTNSYRVGVLRPEQEYTKELQELAQDAGNLTLELAAFLSPAMMSEQTLIPPPSFPSLAEPVELPSDSRFQDVRTMRGRTLASQGGKTHIVFSPRGFSEFAVIRMRMRNNSPITILVNPFTGLTQLYRAEKDFEWTYGRKKKA